MAQSSYVGIDVSKQWLDWGIETTEQNGTEPNTSEGIAELVKRLKKLKPKLVAVEATGRLELPVAMALVKAKIKVAVVNPRQVRDFARALGLLAKTDGIDAVVIAKFARAIEPPLFTPPTPTLRTIESLVKRRRQLLAVRVAERNRRKGLPIELSLARKGIDKHLDWIRDEIARIEEQLITEIGKSPEHSERLTLLCSVPCVGQATAHALIAGLPELGTLNRKEIAALAGVAPFNCETAHKPLRDRVIFGGRADVRSALYMAALVGARCNPDLKPYYEGLVARGKTKKVALTACMRKLLLTLNQIIKTKSRWLPPSERTQAKPLTK